MKTESCVFGRNKAREQEWMERDIKTSKQTTYKSQNRAESIKNVSFNVIAKIMSNKIPAE